MDKALEKLAHQLNQYDAASLMQLWEMYAERVSHFEPSSRWEEAALVLCMIQGVHWKNQLFNAEMLASHRRALFDKKNDHPLHKNLKSLGQPQRKASPAQDDDAASSGGGAQSEKRRKILVFRARNSGKP